jgi:signal transduction histidine kinase
VAAHELPAGILAQYQRLIDISRDLASTLDLDVLLNRIVHAAADLSAAEAASIMLYDDTKNELYFRSATNLDKPVMGDLVVPVEGSIAGWIFSNGQPIIVSDVSTDPRYFANISQSTNFATHSILGVPLTAKDKVIGVLEALNKREGSFTSGDQEILMTLGAQAAVAIENARLFQQSDLISEFVHELRTPLASITTAAHLLQRHEISEEQRRGMAEVVYGETLRLSEMASSFLDLARLESGRTQFNLQMVDLRELLLECGQVVQVKVNELRLDFQIDLPPELPTVEVDRDKIKQVILNLLSNAYKYNRPRGSIAMRAAQKGARVSIEVQDTGLGIDEEDLPHLFEKFYRARGLEKSVTGSGLGLAIARRIVEAHGGQIDVASELGEGTTFSIHLPVHTLETPQVRQTRAPTTP